MIFNGSKSIDPDFNDTEARKIFYVVSGIYIITMLFCCMCGVICGEKCPPGECFIKSFFSETK